ncbi:hypothetical protein BKA58DRAFT_389288 [Alternaria rosae]|uniref:uncharacterized protein n=1 Tax=Alternaria rosae TaxID=1187941 RepID=UPI001E8D7B0F|nr:uncharacterized protein BKA58DRAFT_389288 [Alternaria rosae]KAH6867127.1 hypothetical protein BKA58DRAFT_389288 [Alternaria rosae]
MMLSRTCTRSGAFLRAHATPCSFARPPTLLLHRGKRTKASSPDESEHDATTKSKPSLLSRLRGSRSIFEDDAKMDQAMRPLSDAELERDDLPVINWYEQDLDKGTPQRLIERIATPEDRKKDRDMYLMIEESRKNPDHDDATLNRRLIDSLLTNPNFAELTDELKDIKKSIKSREELQQMKQQGAVEAEAESKQFNAGLRMATLEILQDVLKDPDIGDAKADLQACIDHMPEVENIDNPEFQAMLNKAMNKLEGNEAMQNKVAAMRKHPDSELEREWQTYQRDTEDAIAGMETPDEDLTMATPEDMQDVDKLLHQMRDVMKSFGGDAGLEAELDAVINEDSTSSQDEESVFEREMDPQELAEELKKLAQSKASQPRELVEDEEDVPAELQAKVDEIMKDPKLMEKLMYIQKLISENKQQQGDLTSIAHETAPDPYQLADSRTATLSERMAAALQDPEHSAALQRLRVDLPPPFNIAPALKSFNKAIELAYVGANDDIRRILWRSYQKARSLPTFLQNIGDEAWDILYYSQAVTLRA